MTPAIIGGATLYQGDCREVMRSLADSSVDSIVCDPPYELGFMGKSWDSTGIANNVDVWREALRVLKPGGHLLAFSGTRTSHRMVCAIEDAGFEIRDSIPWLYGSGFPKSLNVSKAIDKAAGADPMPTGEYKRASIQRNGVGENWNAGAFGSHAEESKRVAITAPATDAACQWDGWGTALKPAHEPCCMARKPLIGTVAANVLAHGTGALNIDSCRIASTDDQLAKKYASVQSAGARANIVYGADSRDRAGSTPHDGGRWPANIIHDGSPEVLAIFPESSVTGKRTAGSKAATVGSTAWLMSNHESTEYTDSGSAARFFYCAKASRADRNDGLDSPGPIHKHGVTLRQMENAVRDGIATGNNHPTVKPTDLMAYLVRLVTPPGGLVLDPFMGSGSTGKACMREGFRFIGIDLSTEYVEIARSRIEHEIAAVAARAAAAQEAADLAARQIDLFAEAP